MNTTTTISADAQNLNWLISSFVERVPGVVDAVVVSSDGLLMAMSAGVGRAGGDQLAAVTSGLTSLTRGAARCFGGGDVEQVVVELQEGFMFFMAISGGSSLAVLATRECDVGLVGYEMTMLVKRAGTVLTPAMVSELQSALPAV
jgi:predicted regulator of Ras-like GTPase activity (Roadblock/LC7/MglB family)